MACARLALFMFVFAVLAGCDRPPAGEADHSKHDHSQVNHGVLDHSKMDSSPGAAEAPHELQFIDTMIAHHQGAIDMALLANTRTQREQMKSLTQGIITEQRREIEQMKALRSEWFGEAEAALNVDFPGMKTGMAGMDTVKLAGLKGNEFDVEFLSQMIPHHEGAVEMARALQSDEKYSELRSLAESVVASQTVEIRRMNEWLQAWSAVKR